MSEPIELEEMEEGVTEFNQSTRLQKVKDLGQSAYDRWMAVPKAGRYGIVLGIVLLCFLGCLAVASSVSFYSGVVMERNKYEDGPFVYRHAWDYSFNRTDGSPEAGIQETNEYQVKVHNNRFNSTAKRQTEIDLLTDLMLELLDIKMKKLEPTQVLYRETQYVVKPVCGYRYSELRARDYLLGPHANSSSMSLNIDSKPEKEPSATFPLQPNAIYLVDDDDAEQKLEQDIHACFHKFNRKTKLKNLEMGYRIETCGQMHELFPDSPGFGDADPAEVVEVDEDEIYVWEYSLDGLWHFDTTKFKLMWTLYYDTYEDAINGTNGPSGDSEFSMRFYSIGKGLTDFEHDILVKIGNVFQQVLDRYGDRKYPCD